VGCGEGCELGEGRDEFAAGGVVREDSIHKHEVIMVKVETPNSPRGRWVDGKSRAWCVIGGEVLEVRQKRDGGKEVRGGQAASVAKGG